MDEDLIAKGKQLIEELGEDEELSSKWMAHYVAELMERAQSEDAETRRRAGDLCAEIIIKLWNIKLENQIVQVERDLRTWFKKMPRYDSDERDEKLRSALADPESIPDEVDADAALNLRALREVEDDLIDVWLVAEAAGKPDEKQLNEIAQNFNKSDAEIHAVQQRLTKVLPAFSSLSLIDLEKVREQVLEALQAVDQVRDEILWRRGQASNQESSD